MSHRKLLIIIIPILLVLLVLSVGVLVPIGNVVAHTSLSPDAPPYAAHGSHPVGIRNLVTDGEVPLD
jgi:hypothetical protein